MVSEYMYMNYSSQTLCTKQKNVRVLAQTGQDLFLYVMNTGTRFANPCVHAK